MTTSLNAFKKLQNQPTGAISPLFHNKF